MCNLHQAILRYIASAISVCCADIYQLQFQVLSLVCTAVVYWLGLQACKPKSCLFDPQPVHSWRAAEQGPQPPAAPQTTHMAAHCFACVCAVFYIHFYDGSNAENKFRCTTPLCNDNEIILLFVLCSHTTAIPLVQCTLVQHLFVAIEYPLREAGLLRLRDGTFFLLLWICTVTMPNECCDSWIF